MPISALSPLLLPVVAAVLGSASATAPATPASAALAGAAPPTLHWQWPLAGTPVVARPFQPPSEPWGPGHRGVDLAAAPGASVLAAGAGVVSFAGVVAGIGVVSVRHPDGLRTTYEPVSPLVRAGDAVAAGDPVGRLLPGHGDCGPGRWCLHWGLLRGSTYLDPLTLLRRGPVRLLPLPDRLAPDVATSAGQALRAARSTSASTSPILRAVTAEAPTPVAMAGTTEARSKSRRSASPSLGSTTVSTRRAAAAGAGVMVLVSRLRRRRRVTRPGRHRGTL